MLMNTFSGRERMLALITIAIVLFAMAYIFVIAPLMAGWTNLDSQMRSKIAALEKDSNILANQKTLAAEYANLSKHALSTGSEDQVAADTLVYIENIARNDSCFIVSIKPVGTANAGAYKEILIDVTVEAGITQLFKFIYDLENPRDTLINIKRFFMSAKSGQSGTLKGTFLISKALLQ